MGLLPKCGGPPNLILKRQVGDGRIDMEAETAALHDYALEDKGRGPLVVLEIAGINFALVLGFCRVFVVCSVIMGGGHSLCRFWSALIQQFGDPITGGLTLGFQPSGAQHVCKHWAGDRWRMASR